MERKGEGGKTLLPRREKVENRHLLYALAFVLRGAEKKGKRKRVVSPYVYPQIVRREGERKGGEKVPEVRGKTIRGNKGIGSHLP